MRVFLAGASGAIGTPLLPRLLEAGHEVVALARTPERAAALRATGAETAVADALDARALHGAIIAARPEVVVNQLTALPAVIRPRHYAADLAATTELRRTAYPVVARAAADAGARRVIAQSVSFMLDPAGPWVQDEAAPLMREPPPSTRAAVASMHALEDATLGTPGVQGVVLRYGFFYGSGQLAPGGSMAEDVRRRRLPVVGSGEGRFSFIHVEDAADATVLALDRGEPGIYNVTDDAPAPQREWVPGLARIMGAKAPRHVPLWLAKLAAGPMALGAVSMRGADNAKARAQLGWAPSRPTWREGFAEVFAGG
jgi:nucleoside-diphosphate-sugar epimerase